MFQDNTVTEEFQVNQGNIKLSSNITVPYIALSFPDPEQRKDRAGRIIPHEIALLGEEIKAVQDIRSAVNEIWKTLSSTYSILYPLSATEVDKRNIEVRGDSLYLVQKEAEINALLAEDKKPNFQPVAIAIAVIAIVAIVLMLSLQYLEQNRNPGSSPEFTNSKISQVTGSLTFSEWNA
ncbi:hypothetical protein [Phormidium sp. FACHB-1136]|uniref:hypothetical protein n=1 Tax=Phormidium sp. FACHB-1136 TaxID=2692848 RepID=UPI001686AC9E|nr:hypothetical protein [Phormidium sp. FACHB-1136]MBD2427362.1 hypothetical protein [Phormidium sp. FACHB-1136]